jgi:glycogen operon protein
LNVTEGRPEPLGVTPDASGANVAVVSERAETIAICLFDEADHERATLTLPGRTGDVFHGHVEGLRPGMRYGLRAWGPWEPARGSRFNPAKLLVDPYATALDRPFISHPSLVDGDRARPEDTASLVPKGIVAEPAGSAPARPPFDWDHQVIYELHVRGFTRLHPAVPEPIRGTFAALGHPAIINHLKRLGVTTIELMPCAAWTDDRHLPALGLGNYWGYNPVALLVPDPRLAPGGWPEVRAAVSALQQAGFSVIVDIVLNHTGEGDELGPTLSLRGLDNALYYRLLPEDPSRFVNDAGTGNILALDRPQVVRLAMTAFRTWLEHSGIDGFRLDLATVLGRRDHGFDPAAPLLTAMQQDPLLASRVLIAEPWDIGYGGYQLGSFPAGWGEWNDRFRNTVRRFWRGDAGMLGELATRLAGSADIFAGRHRPLTRSINYVTAHDGFTLADLVSYEKKHNEANREHNRDGSDDNLSWNNGAEGETNDPAIIAARKRDMRALLATLLMARGTPMLPMGDEGGRTQHGNNNPYTQDNEISWLDWSALDDGQIDFTARLIALRRDCAALRGGRPLAGAPLDDSLIPDVTWHLADGSIPSPVDWQDGGHRTLMAVFYAQGCRAAVVLHAGREPTEIVPPPPRQSWRWCCALDSANPERGEPISGRLNAAPRSVLILVEQPAPASGIGRALPPDALDQLARAAGIAEYWWSVDGEQTFVSDETKRALLAAMRLPAGTPGELSDSLARIATRNAAPLPASFVAVEDEPVEIPVGFAARGRWLRLEYEDGQTVTIPVSHDTDRRTLLPAMPPGRHRVCLDGTPDAVCHLTIAPRCCYLPPELAAGHRRFGIATHLYTLRRPGDQGIGDFTSMAQFAQEAAEYGASVLGLNPLHALFPGDRGRASPYHPSDRRFLDPIYLDVAGLPGADAVPPDGFTVDYPAVWAAKRRALSSAFRSGGAEEPAFQAFLDAGGTALRNFARFEAIAEAQGSPHWQTWPEQLRHPGSAAVQHFAEGHTEAVRFSAWLQFQCERQLGAAAAASRLPLGLYRDLAVGSAPDGAEAWSRQDVLLTGVSVGAPPDPFSQEGQVWSLPPPDPLAMTEEGYAGFVELLAANMRHAGALRIDHVLGLRRLFLVPDGARAREGAYLSYPFEDLVGQLTLESQRARCLVVGEDLGTVPEGFSARTQAAGVLSYKVLWFQRSREGFEPPARWPTKAAACVSTHDLPTLAGWWEAADIAEQQSIGLMDPAAADKARKERQSDKRQLLDLLRAEELLTGEPDLDAPLPPEIAGAVHAMVATTPSLLALIQADDLAGETQAVNLPGTDRERPNWRRRLHLNVDALCRSPVAVAIRAAMERDPRAAERLPRS